MKFEVLLYVLYQVPVVIDWTKPRTELQWF